MTVKPQWQWVWMWLWMSGFLTGICLTSAAAFYFLGKGREEFVVVERELRLERKRFSVLLRYQENCLTRVPGRDAGGSCCQPLPWDSTTNRPIVEP